MTNGKYLDRSIIEESESVLERIKNYTPEERKFYFKGFADALEFMSEFTDLDIDLFIKLILRKIN